MPKLKLNIDYKRPQEQIKEDVLSDPELSVNYIEFAFGNVYRDGLEGQLRRIVSRIQRKLETGIEDKTKIAKEVELEVSELELIQKTLQNAKFPPLVSRYVILLEDEIEETLKPPKEDKKDK